MSHTKILSEEVTFKAKNAFEVKRETLLLPNKETMIHYTAWRVLCVLVFPVTADYEVYLISQYRYLLNKNILEAVSGRIDGKESPLRAARRELQEEAGIRADQWEEIARIELAPSFFRAKVYLFLARDLEIGEQKLEDDETIEVSKLPLTQAVEKTMTGEINDSATMTGILILDKLRQERKL